MLLKKNIMFFFLGLKVFEKCCKGFVSVVRVEGFSVVYLVVENFVDIEYFLMLGRIPNFLLVVILLPQLI